MLDAQDLKIIQEKMDLQKKEILNQTATDMRAMEKRILEQTATDMRAMEKRILEQTATDMRTMEKRILEQSAANMRVILESSIGPQLALLAEGQTSLLAKMAPRSELEQLRSDMDFLKTVVKTNTRDIEKLKKAK